MYVDTSAKSGGFNTEVGEQYFIGALTERDNYYYITVRKDLIWRINRTTLEAQQYIGDSDSSRNWTESMNCSFAEKPEPRF